MTQSPTITNAERAIRFELALMHYNDECDAATNLVDLLIDVRHWCDIKEWDYDDLGRMAHAKYLAELEIEGGQP